MEIEKAFKRLLIKSPFYGLFCLSLPKRVTTSVPTLGFGNMATATQNASNWQVVPEPTSGLMLLLGVAGLALKRKRA